MSFEDRLIHSLSVVSQAETDEVDDYNQPVTTPQTRTIMGLPQPKRIREVTAIHQAGATIGTWTIFTAMDDIAEADDIYHVQATCAVPDEVDLGDLHFTITGVRIPAGVGHHLEIDAMVVEGAALEAAAS